VLFAVEPVKVTTPVMLFVEETGYGSRTSERHIIYDCTNS
jgi:hypothetical protein